MNTLPTKCPICGGDVTVTRIYCPSCDTTIESHFIPGPFAQLNADQITFIETFVRCEGRLNRMETELGISYPTIRNRLMEVIRALGYEPGGDEIGGVPGEIRQQVLDDLDQGRISADEAMRILRENEAK